MYSPQDYEYVRGGQREYLLHCRAARRKCLMFATANRKQPAFVRFFADGCGVALRFTTGSFASTAPAASRYAGRKATPSEHCGQSTIVAYIADFAALWSGIAQWDEQLEGCALVGV
jgi:hypothetical protein